MNRNRRISKKKTEENIIMTKPLVNTPNNLISDTNEVTSAEKTGDQKVSSEKTVEIQTEGTIEKCINAKQAEAIYVINKVAKQLRDLKKSIREKVKARLFNGETVDLTPEETDILNKFGVDDINKEISIDNRYLDTTLPKYWKHPFSSIKNEDTIFEEWIDSCCTSDNFRKIFNIVYDYDYYQLHEDSESELWEQGFTNSDIEDIMMCKEVAGEITQELYEIRKRHELLHQFLHYGCDLINYQKEFLYNLKSCVLQKSGFSPIAYHRLAHSDYTLLEYYEIHGFKFHNPVDIDGENENLVSDNEIEQISAPQNPLPDNIPVIHESIILLLNYLNLDPTLYDKYIEGKAEMPSKILHIDVTKPVYNDYFDERFYRYNSHSDDSDEDDFFEDYSDEYMTDVI